MEIIRKKINIESSKSHSNCGLPYILFNKPYDGWHYFNESGGCFGNFLSDLRSEDTSGLPDYLIDESGRVRTCNLFRNYNELLEILRNGIHLKHIKNSAQCLEDSYTNNYTMLFDYTGTTKNFLDEAVVVNLFNEDDEEQFNLVGDGIYYSELDINSDYIILLNNYDYYLSLGGSDLINFVKTLLGQKVEVVPLIPYISIPLFLSSDVEDDGLVTPYHDEENEFLYTQRTKSYDVKYQRHTNSWVLRSSTEEYSGITAESKISTLQAKKYATTDNGTILPGCFKDEDIISYVNGQQLRTIKLDLPYVERFVLNKDSLNSTYTGDYIKTISFSGDYVTFKYVLGAVFTDEQYLDTVEDTGVEYEETYRYYKNASGITERGDSIYGVSGVTYYYDYIDFDYSKTSLINETYNLEKEGNLADIKSFTRGDVWRTDGSVLNTPLIKEECLLGVSNEPIIDVDVTINRGNAAAFEKHLVLSECNSFDDIESYRGETMFNIE